MFFRGKIVEYPQCLPGIHATKRQKGEEDRYSFLFSDTVYSKCDVRRERSAIRSIGESMCVLHDRWKKSSGSLGRRQNSTVTSEIMTDMVDLEEWKENEKFCVLHAIFKLMTPEQRNIVTVRSKCVCTLKLIVTDYCVFMC